MNEEMIRDIERHEMEREHYLARRRDIFERQTQLMSLLYKFIFPMIFMVIAMILLEPAKNLMSQYERILSAEANGMERIPELKKQIQILEKQLANLSNASIEKRLSNIEKSIAVGDIDVEEVATLQKLRTDFDAMKTYMFSDPEDLVKLKTLQRDYKEITLNIEKYVHKDVVDRELNFLNNTLQILLWFIGILISIAVGSWLFTLKKLKAINSEELNK